MQADTVRESMPARVRVLVSFAAGGMAGVVASLTLTWQYGFMLGWMVAAVTFLTWTWCVLWPMDAATTERHAVTEDPGRTLTDVLVLVIAVASLVAVGLLLASGGTNATDADVQAALSVGSVALAWAAVHTVFTTRYARLYYGEDGGIDFNEDARPRYSDFAYLAFTIGMTFQVSDTDLKTRRIRATALRHGLLSYLFGTVIVATTINLVAGLHR